MYKPFTIDNSILYLPPVSLLKEIVSFKDRLGKPNYSEKVLTRVTYKKLFFPSSEDTETSVSKTSLENSLNDLISKYTLSHNRRAKFSFNHSIVHRYSDKHRT